MDIKTVRTRLVNNHYHCGAHALEDLKKVFTNCIRYNPKGHDVHVMGVKVQAVLHEKLSGLPEKEEEILPKHRQSSIGLPQVSNFSGSSTRQSSIKEEPIQKSVSKRPPTGVSSSEVASKRQKNSSGETTGSSSANKKESSNNSQGGKKQLIKSEKREQISLNDKSSSQKASTANQNSKTTSSTTSKDNLNNTFSSSITSSGTAANDQRQKANQISGSSIKSEATRQSSRSSRPPKQIYDALDNKEPLSKEIRSCIQIVKDLMSKNKSVYSHPFHKPVDTVTMGLVDYFDIIKKPMDFSTLLDNAEKHYYATHEAFTEDLRLVWRNCYLYNPEHHEVCTMAKKCENFYEERYRKVIHEFKSWGLKGIHIFIKFLYLFLDNHFKTPFQTTPSQTPPRTRKSPKTKRTTRKRTSRPLQKTRKTTSPLRNQRRPQSRKTQKDAQKIVQRRNIFSSANQ